MNRNAQIERFVDGLRGQALKRVLLSQIRACFLVAFPEYRHVGNLEKLLLEHIGEIAQLKIVRLPKERKHYESGGPVRLPRWIMRIDRPKERPVGPPEDYYWHPELAELAPKLRRLQKDDLLKINEFLIARQGNLTRVPVRERLLQVFGDEKKLSVRRDGLFGGRLKLSTIGAYDPPLPFCSAGPSRPAPGLPLLVVENHHTFASFLAANDELRVFSAIAYGVGHAFSKSALGLDEVAGRFRATKLHYFGDLDGRGLATPYCVAQARERDGLSPLEPARELYRWLLDHGTRRPNSRRVGTQARTSAQVWLGGAEGDRIADLWKSKERIPQESLGLEQMMQGALGGVAVAALGQSAWLAARRVAP